MNEHAGPACALSVLIIGIFAVFLHETDQAQLPSGAVIRHSCNPMAGRSDSETDGVAPRLIRETALVTPPRSQTSIKKEATTSAEVRDPRPWKDPAISERAMGGVSTAVPSSDPPVVQRADPGPQHASPRSPYTVVGQGETLADVATRVYGSPDAKETVWKANRDQIAQIDSPLACGALLRTP